MNRKRAAVVAALCLVVGLAAVVFTRYPMDGDPGPSSLESREGFHPGGATGHPPGQSRDPQEDAIPPSEGRRGLYPEPPPARVDDIGPGGISEHQRFQTFPSFPEHIVYRMGLYPKESDEGFSGVARFAGLRPGWTVADIGCGGGRITFHMARAVGPEGKVYALDIVEAAIGVLRSYMKEPKLNPYDNIVAVRNKPDDTLLEANVLDQAWMLRLHFHSFVKLLPENVRMIRSIYRALKPGGTLLIEDGDEKGMAKGDAMKNVIRHYQEAGFVRIEDRTMTVMDGMGFTLMFRKPS